jgi:hypothetical protein
MEHKLEFFKTLHQGGKNKLAKPALAASKKQ